MKKHILLVIILIVFVVFLCFQSSNINKEVHESNSIKKKYNTFSMMFETSYGSGIYEEQATNNWPTTGYKFNEELSGCENGSELSWDDINNKVIVRGMISDKCYIYFNYPPQVELTMSNNTFSWDEIENATSYNIYVDDVLVTNVSNPSIELYKYLKNAGTYSVKVAAVDGSNNELSYDEYDSYTVSQVSPTTKQFISDNGGYSKPEYSEFVIPDFDYINVLNFNKITTHYHTQAPIEMEEYVGNNNLGWVYGWNNWWEDPYWFYDNNVFSDFCALNSELCDTYSNITNLKVSCYILNLMKDNFDIIDSSTYDATITINKNEHRLYYNSLPSHEDQFYIQFGKDGYVPSEWVTFWPDWTCFDENTVVYYYDEKKRKFKKKKAKNVKYKDKLLVWDFDNGCFAIANPLWIKQKETIYQYNLLKFSDGSTLKTVGHHRIFNIEKGRFTYPLTNDTPIGTTTFNSKGEYVKLVSAEIIHKKINFCNIITNYHMNLFTNDILTSCRLNNIYEINDMKFVKDGRKLKTRDDFEGIDEKWFNGLRLSEYNDSVNKDARHAKELKDYIKRLKNLAKKDN